jgi:hypothetical protein
MKNFKIILLTIVLFSLLSFQESYSLVGKWELFKLEASDGKSRVTSGHWMHFMKNGILKGGDTLESTDREGTWSYDAETKKLTFGSEEKLSGEGTYTIHWVDAKTIYIVVERGRKMHMKKIQ